MALIPLAVSELKFKVKAVIFDMDGVITDTMPYHFRAWQTVFAKAGLDVTRCEIFLREGQPGSVTIGEIFRDHGRRISAVAAAQMLRAKERLFKRIVRRRFVKGSRSFIRFLARQGIAVALVTGTARHEALRILPKSLLALFCVMITGDDVKKGKPHPEPFLSAIKALAIKPREAVVIENAPFGIHSAKKAHLKCLALTTSLSKSYLAAADHVFTSFAGLRRWVNFTRLTP